MPTDEPIICRQFSLPSSLIGVFDSALAALVFDRHWVIGDSVGAASVEDVVAAYKLILDQSWARGCRMVGEILELATADIPAWALLCDGSEYLRADYPELVAVIHPGLLTDATHFRVPDRLDRFGNGGQITGNQGGEATHTLISGEMPAHSHSDLGHQHTEIIPLGEGLALAPGELPVVLAQSAALTGIASANIQTSGGGGAHNNMPPWEGTQYVIVAVSQ